jgi:hypothetical protein
MSSAVCSAIALGPYLAVSFRSMSLVSIRVLSVARS